MVANVEFLHFGKELKEVRQDCKDCYIDHKDSFSLHCYDWYFEKKDCQENLQVFSSKEWKQ